MKRFGTIIGVTVAIAALMVSVAEAKTITKLGDNPYVGTVEQLPGVIAKCFPLPKEVGQKLVAALGEYVVDKGFVAKDITESNLASSAREELLKKLEAKKIVYFAGPQLDFLPDGLRKQIITKYIKTEAFTTSFLKSGDRFKCMPFGNGGVEVDVLYNGKPEPGIRVSIDHQGVRYTFFHPFACNNTFVQVVEVDLRIEGTNRPPVRETAQPGLEGVRTWRTDLWSWKNSTSAGREILSLLVNEARGRQSIDLHERILAAYVSGDIKPYTASCEFVKFEWFDTDTEAYLKDTIWVSSIKEKPDGSSEVRGVSPRSASQGLYTCDGRATLTIRVKPSWAKEDMSYAVTTPQGLHLKYPKGHVLYSCGRRTADVCAAAVRTPTISYSDTQRAGVRDLHFVVDD